MPRSRIDQAAGADGVRESFVCTMSVPSVKVDKILLGNLERCTRDFLRANFAVEDAFFDSRYETILIHGDEVLVYGLAESRIPNKFPDSTQKIVVGLSLRAMFEGIDLSLRVCFAPFREQSELVVKTWPATEHQKAVNLGAQIVEVLNDNATLNGAFHPKIPYGLLLRSLTLTWCLAIILLALSQEYTWLRYLAFFGILSILPIFSILKPYCEFDTNKQSTKNGIVRVLFVIIPLGVIGSLIAAVLYSVNH
jgi:hypothetical protein